jgi:hypothetical protein
VIVKIEFTSLLNKSCKHSNTVYHTSDYQSTSSKQRFYNNPILSWASADFFPGESKNFPRAGGKNLLFALKITKKILFVPKKSKKHTIFGRPARGGGKSPHLPLPLRTSMYPVKLCNKIVSCKKFF